MELVFDRILTFNLIGTTLVFYVAARIYLLPRLGRLRPSDILIPVLLLHSLRHLGLMFLTRGATYPGMPSQFAYPAALGDLVAAALAFVTIPLLSRKSSAARPMVWAFNLLGSVDLLAAITLATIYRAPLFMGPSYWIPAFWVPALLVTHYITFQFLIKHWKVDG
ncbi:MAG: hypothetical protein ACM3KE_04330 [Hyphomicrobiales bacterium]